jgi:hypothetical protein
MPTEYIKQTDGTFLKLEKIGGGGCYKRLLHYF